MRFNVAFSGALVMVLFSATAIAANEPVPESAELLKAAAKAIPVLQRGAEGHMAERKCFACHHQTLPLLALQTGRSRGLKLNDEFEQRLLRFVEASLESGRERYLEGRGQGGNAVTAGYALWTLSIGGKPRSATTDMVADFLTGFQKDSIHWRITTNRPPSEGSHFAATYVAVRSLRAYGTDSQREAIDRRLAEVRDWLIRTPGKDTEDRVFRLASLARVDASRAQVQVAADELLQTQREDGGWGQLDAAESDAYATGSALFALYETGTLPCSAPASSRALRYLLQTQQADGSWHVRSRSKPIQTYFETGFPHEKDQFISSAATGWAATVLLMAHPRVVDEH